MHTLTLISQKGGAGKSTLAIHLAVEAAAHGLRTLLLDLDPQGSAVSWADRRQPGSLDIDAAIEVPARLEAALKAALAEGYDQVVIDTAPHSDQAALRAARLADFLLVPVRCSILDISAMSATRELCELARRPVAVVLNATPVRSRVVEETAAAMVELGFTVCDAVVRERVAFRHALIDGRVAREFEPGGRAAAEITALYMKTCLCADTHTQLKVA
jgi:chromosome partitioning protein